MKKNWVQLVTLCLCLILLVIAIRQGNQLKEFREQTNEQIEILQSAVINTIQSNVNSVVGMLQEAEGLVADYTLESNGIDKGTHSLKLAVSVTLKKWHEDTELMLLAKTGAEEISFPMVSDSDGVYSKEILLPLETGTQTSFEVMITGEGGTQREILRSLGDITYLLPVQHSGRGWAGLGYEAGRMSNTFNIELEGQNGILGDIENARFLTYRNGELVQTQKAVLTPSSTTAMGRCYTVDTEEHLWSTECEEGDIIEIRFCFEDEYGLGYDFWYQTWSVDDKGNVNAVVNDSTESSDLRLYWPE